MSTNENMNKQQFVSFIASLNNCTLVYAQEVVDIFTNALHKALEQKKDVSLVGFFRLTSQHVPVRDGRNPKTGAKMHIKAYNKPSFRAGKNLKDACNS